MLFGRDPRTQLDDLAAKLDDEVAGVGLERTIEDKRQMAREVRKALAQRQAYKNRQREAANARIARTSPGAKAQVGDKVLV